MIPEPQYRQKTAPKPIAFRFISNNHLISGQGSGLVRKLNTHRLLTFDYKELTFVS